MYYVVIRYFKDRFDASKLIKAQENKYTCRFIYKESLLLNFNSDLFWLQKEKKN